MSSARPAARSPSSGPSALGLLVIQEGFGCTAVHQHYSASIEQTRPLLSRSRPHETTAEVVVNVPALMLIIISDIFVGAVHSSGEGAVLLWAWRSLLIAAGVVSSHGLVDGAPVLFSGAPAARSSCDCRKF